ncbi:MAG: biotin/lipoyl-binding protein, partial [Candidatus Acidiferrales bacterium]
MAENRQRKWVIWGIAAILVVVVVAVLALREPAAAVRVVSITSGDLSSTITSNGKVEPILPFVARAQFPSFVAEVKAAEGQAVHRGQLILRLDDSDIRAQLSQARADLLAAETDLRNAKAGGPPDEVAQLQGNLQNAETQVANLERTQQALQQLVTKQAATQDEVAQNKAALATARTNLQTWQEKKAALAQRGAVTAQSA